VRENENLKAQSGTILQSKDELKKDSGSSSLAEKNNTRNKVVEINFLMKSNIQSLSSKEK
jgi:hypothetical protein